MKVRLDEDLIQFDQSGFREQKKLTMCLSPMNLHLMGQKLTASKYSHFYQLSTFWSELQAKFAYTSHSFLRQRHYATNMLVLCQHNA